MKIACRLISYAGLVLLFAASILVFEGRLSGHAYRVLGMVGTVAWFVTVPFWMHRRLHNPPD